MSYNALHFWRMPAFKPFGPLAYFGGTHDSRGRSRHPSRTAHCASGTYGGSLKDTPPTELAAAVSRRRSRVRTSAAKRWITQGLSFSRVTPSTAHMRGKIPSLPGHDDDAPRARPEHAESSNRRPQSFEEYAVHQRA
jgi:hypothetical protein